MTEYVEKEEAIKAIANDLPEQVRYSREDAGDCIRYMDAADVAPVRHGRWIIHQAFEGKRHNCNECIECSECNTWFGHDCYAKTNYCPNCGAKMDGGIAT